VSVDDLRPQPERTSALHQRAVLARVQGNLASRDETRRCPLCAQRIRSGEACRQIHGTTVHTRCPHPGNGQPDTAGSRQRDGGSRLERQG